MSAPDETHGLLGTHLVLNLVHLTAAMRMIGPILDRNLLSSVWLDLPAQVWSIILWRVVRR